MRMLSWLMSSALCAASFVQLLRIPTGIAGYATGQQPIEFDLAPPEEDVLTSRPASVTLPRRMLSRKQASSASGTVPADVVPDTAVPRVKLESDSALS